MKKYKCCKCDNIAVWTYMPACDDEHFYCDDHVPRGCSCHTHCIDMDEPTDDELKDTVWWSKEKYDYAFNNHEDPMKYATSERKDDSFYFEVLDANGRRFPCCEFDYDEDGFEIE